MTAHPNNMFVHFFEGLKAYGADLVGKGGQTRELVMLEGEGGEGNFVRTQVLVPGQGAALL